MERPDSRLIRVFLSSTFVDFQEERSLLVQQVFPSLRRRARSREVEIVDVDLRWGVTAEQTEQGETLPLCLGEIDRCRPYFISLLGERYGWVPPPDYYKPELLERQPWLKERMGGASVTELEILHGVLRNPEMAGHAFFYLRDPAYAQAQSEPGWVAENPAERQRLEALKAQIRTSGFPVTEGLPSPQAIAERIEADLWQLIESRFPEQEPADALEREDRRHSDYRRARTGLYLGGGPAIEQLERWITDGEQRILITGDSGAGKSALIANWLAAHQRNHPQDLVHAHHLGCTNDASAVRPLLGRLIDTASKLLLQEQQISEPIQVPQDWWELVFKVGEVFALLSPWCQRQGRRWILVLDGLDRLAEDDQQALPWIPTTIPPGIHVVASALDCPAHTILQERQYCTHEIGPLGKAEQQQLIERYLSRYTKKLESGLQQRILAHPLAGSPLFLRVLLEELRQCAWHDTLVNQLEFYLSAETIDGLYSKVLERLESDGHGEATRKALTALWASRAGLSEEELLAITELAPLQWAPIDLALEQAFGRNGNRLVIDHNYMYKAVQGRYLPTEDERRQAHSDLADCFGGFRNRRNKVIFFMLSSLAKKAPWRFAEEVPWQLYKSYRRKKLRAYLLSDMLNIAELHGWHELKMYMHASSVSSSDFISSIRDMALNVAGRLTKSDQRSSVISDIAHKLGSLADLLESSGFSGQLLLQIRQLALASLDSKFRNETKITKHNKQEAEALVRALKSNGNHEQAKSLMHGRFIKSWLLMGQIYLGSGEPCKAEYSFRRWAQEHGINPNGYPQNYYQLVMAYWLASVSLALGEHQQAESSLTLSLHACKSLVGPEHHITLDTMEKLGVIYKSKGDYEQAEDLYTRCLEARERLLGPEHPSTLTTVNNLASLFQHKGDYKQAETYLTRCLGCFERLLGPEHPSTLATISNCAALFHAKGDNEMAESFYSRCLEARERVLGTEHYATLITVNNLGALYRDKGDYEQAEAYLTRCLEAEERLRGADTPSALTALNNLGLLYCNKGDYKKSEGFYLRCINGSEKILGMGHHETLIAVYNLGCLYKEEGRYDRSQLYLERALEGFDRIVGPEHSDSLNAARYLAEVLVNQGHHADAIPLRKRELTWSRKRYGENDPATLMSINDLAIDLRETGSLKEAEALFRELVAGRLQVLEPSDFQIGRALGGLAKTLEEAGKLNEALDYAQQALTHRLEHDGPDTWNTNLERLDLARILHKLSRDGEALSHLDDLQASLARLAVPEESDQQLLAEANDVRAQIEAAT